jgi:hypothetical protein
MRHGNDERRVPASAVAVVATAQARTFRSCDGGENRGLELNVFCKPRLVPQIVATVPIPNALLGRCEDRIAVSQPVSRSLKWLPDKPLRRHRSFQSQDCAIIGTMLALETLINRLALAALFNICERSGTMDCGFLIDMDGVIYHGNQLVPGADRFITGLLTRNIPFLFLTNNSQRTRRDVAVKLRRLGIDVSDDHIFTCAMATARFLAAQKPHGTAYVIGEGGLLHALHHNGYSVVDTDPDYVVVGRGG